MASSLPPDPYLALGVSQDADTAAIKSAHRKLALKNHPDKVTDPALKQNAADNFHKIQSAYEILVDEGRRARYDAEVKLHSLRMESAQDRMSRDSPRARDRKPTSTRSSYEYAGPKAEPYSRDSGRRSPVYEERRPAYTSADPYDSPPPRATTRKDPRDSDYDRPSRRSAPASKEKPRATAQRDAKAAAWTGRRERTKNTDKEQRRDRDRKYRTYADTTSDTDSDDYDRYAKPDEERKAREAYHEQVRKQRDEAERGYFADDRTRKLFTQDNDARSHMEKSRTTRRPTESDRRSNGERKPEVERMPEADRRQDDRRPDYDRRADERRTSYDRRLDSDRDRRPSPPNRMASTRDRTDSDPRPNYSARQPSSRPATTGRDMPESTRRPLRDDRRTSEDIIDDVRRPMPPPLHTSKTSPAGFPMDKPRAYSLQPESGDTPLPPPPPRRAGTMPIDRSERTVPILSTKADQPNNKTEFSHGMPTPETTPGATPTDGKYNYGRHYADDHEIATPDGYQTEYRAPRDNARDGTRERSRDGAPPDPRSSSSSRRTSTAHVARHGPSASASTPVPAIPSLGRATSYRYTEHRAPSGGVGGGVPGMTDPFERDRDRTRDRDRDRVADRDRPRHTPPLSRGASGGPREMFGAVRESVAATAAANVAGASVRSGSARYASREVRPSEDGYRLASGGHGSRKGSAAEGHGRPGASRSGSGNPVHVR